MKIKKEALIGILVLVVFAGGITGIYNFQKHRTRNDLASRIFSLRSRGGPPETIEGLRKAIDDYEAQIETYIRDAAQTAVYWKILATRLQDRGLHLEALEALERAIAYNAEDPSLRYMTGVSASMVARGAVDFPDGKPAGTPQIERYYTLAEEAFLRAIAMDSGYTRPLYALGVLYVFELDRPEDAIPHLVKYLDITLNNDVDGMFVLARAYFMTSEYQAALDLYDRILSKTKDSAKKTEAEKNRQYIMEVYYG